MIADAGVRPQSAVTAMAAACDAMLDALSRLDADDIHAASDRLRCATEAAASVGAWRDDSDLPRDLHALLGVVERARVRVSLMTDAHRNRVDKLTRMGLGSALSPTAIWG